MFIINVVVYVTVSVTNVNINEYALVPAYLPKMVNEYAYTTFTSIFMHANLIHIIFNMLALVTLGRIIEPHIGWRRFLFVYMLSGFSGAGLHTLYAFAVGGNEIYTPVVGASGAISGIIGIAAAFGDRIGIIWLILQVPFAFSSASLGGLHVAVFAHLGGFIFGFASGRIMLYIRKRRLGEYSM
jgi:rhomboid protease GluP